MADTWVQNKATGAKINLKHKQKKLNWGNYVNGHEHDSEQAHARNYDIKNMNWADSSTWNMTDNLTKPEWKHTD